MCCGFRPNPHAQPETELHGARRRRRPFPPATARIRAQTPLGAAVSRGCAPPRRRPSGTRTAPAVAGPPAHPAGTRRARALCSHASDPGGTHDRNQRSSTALRAPAVAESQAAGASDREPLAAFVATPLERQAARTRLHASPESVGASALALLRLIGPLHSSRSRGQEISVYARFVLLLARDPRPRRSDRPAPNSDTSADVGRDLFPALCANAPPGLHRAR